MYIYIYSSFTTYIYIHIVFSPYLGCTKKGDQPLGKKPKVFWSALLSCVCVRVSVLVLFCLSLSLSLSFLSRSFQENVDQTLVEMLR